MQKPPRFDHLRDRALFYAPKHFCICVCAGWVREGIRTPKPCGIIYGCDATTQTENVSFMKKITGLVQGVVIFAID